MFRFKLKKKSGQAIIEAVVALASILLILSAISIAVITSINNTDFIKKQTLAKKSGEQGMEYIRFLRNNNPGDAGTGLPAGSFFSFVSNDTYCMDDSDPPVISPGACGVINVGGYFKRDVTFSHDDSQCGGGGTKVTIIVSWTDSKCSSGSFCHSSRLVSCFPSIPDSLKTL